MSDVDFGKRSSDYALHRPGFPRTFFERLEVHCPLVQARVLDLGTGPGTVALELARRGARVTGIDVASNQLDAARRTAAGLDVAERCSFQLGAAERLDFEEAAFDLATAGQCWHWFDKPVVLAELQRVLAPGALLVVAYYSYLALHSELVQATEALILERNPAWTMAGSAGTCVEDIDELMLAGFELVEQFCYDHERTFTHAGWRGRMRTCNGVGSGGLAEPEVEAFDQSLAELLRTRFPEEPVSVPHRVWATVVRRP